MITTETLRIPAETLAHLATRASTLEERLSPPFIAESENTEEIEAHVSRWAEFGAKNNRERLQRSLQWRGIDLDRVRPALGGATLSPGAPLPDWVLRFAALVEVALTEYRYPAPDSPPPINERAIVMGPFLRALAAELRREIPPHIRAYVSEGALAALEGSLLLRFVRLTSTTLGGDYYVYSFNDSRAGGDAETRAQRFADGVLESPLPQFLVEYPVLARLVTLACDNWKAAALELLGRLADDRQAIIERFHEGRDPGPLVDIQVGDADVHDGHREVVILVFEDGFRVVYKPRPMALDQAVHELIHWLNERGLTPSLRSPAVLPRGEYGWAEFIVHRLANGPEELALFYERAGALACFAHVLGSTDLHHGNVIAEGGYPVVIDLETMLKAEPRIGALAGLAGAGQIANLGMERSVLQSMFLPLTYRVPTGVYADLSALGAEPAPGPAKESAKWLPVQDVPLQQVLRDHLPAIEKGFASAYRFIESQREALLAEGGPLAAFDRSAIRVVLRDTSLYFQLLRHSIDPTVLRDSIDRMISLERVNHIIAISDTAPSFIDMITHEQATLMRLDVPRFLVMTDETDLRDAAGLVAANVMERTPLAEARLRIEAMSEADLQRQCTDIRLSFTGHIAGGPESRRANAAPAAAAELPDTATLISAAERLGEDLLPEATGDAPLWRGLIYLPAARRFTAGSPGASFADGGLGVAAFFAALFRVTGNAKWREAAVNLSLRYLAPVTDSTVYSGHVAGGITMGLGGTLYGAALIGALTDNKEIPENALSLALALAKRAVAEEREFSLGDGLAGTLIGIAALHHLAPNAVLGEVVELGAARLRDAKPLAGTGLFTGQAGVALAANTISPDGKFPAPELPGTDDGIDWGEGKTGLSLAILKADPGAAQALDFLESLASAPGAADDSFAFGSAGEADALVWAADLTGRPELRHLALQRIAGAAQRAHRGAPHLLGGLLTEGLRIPGLLNGSAGVGYALLRLAAPGQLPALAAFELPAGRKVE
jgi:type 2 lantibiotic biosynthesis protein LanM